MKLKFHFRRFRRLKAVLRLSYFFVILVLSSFMFTELVLMIKKTEHHVMLESNEAFNKYFTEIVLTARQLYHLNSSASSLARTLSSSLNETELSFANVQTKVAPTLFLALSTIPKLSQVSFIGLDGRLFSFYNDQHQTLAVYSNTSFSSNWYTQPVNRDTGKLYGDAIPCNSMQTVNATWFQQALNNTNGYTSLETGWNKAQDSLFLNAVAMDGRGVISLGFPTKIIVDQFAALDFHGGYFHLGTLDGQVIMQTELPNTRIQIYGTTVILKRMKPNGDFVGHDNLSCNSDDGTLRSIHRKIEGIKYAFYCSTIDVAGVQSVYVLAYPKSGLMDLVRRNSTLSLLLLALVFIFIIISLCIYICLTARATNREMILCAALIKQTEATQQAERKSMNKTKAFAGANHDVRASLAAITSLIQLCQNDVRPSSELADNLGKIENCTKDLLGILSSILDTSKIEAGKASLEIEDFNLVQLLEDVVDMFYPLGMRKGLDVVLDPCDGSILKSPFVSGDRIKLKQILCNLLSNAIKFTSEGHVSVRAVVKKNNFKKEIIASNSTTALRFLSWFCFRNKEGSNDLDALHTIKENPNEMEFEFEVDDTGKGIPKDKQKSVFEDYVQVKETAAGQEGCGLGLGIVQSLVRVMKGELSIVEKEPGERGTCFKFNVFLSTSESESSAAEEDRLSSGFHQHFTFMSPKPEGSHVIMFIAGEERRKVLKKYIESLNVKVTIIKQVENLHSELEKTKRKLEFSSFNTGKRESSFFEYLSKSASTNSDPGATKVHLSIKDGGDHITPHYKKSNSRSSSCCMLIVIDATAAGYYSDFHNILDDFRKDIPKSSCKVVWLDDPMMGHSEVQTQDRLSREGDFIIRKPLHGSCLTQMLSLLPECKGTPQCSFSKFSMGATVQEAQHPVYPNPSNNPTCVPECKSTSQCSFSKISVGATVQEVWHPVDRSLSSESNCSWIELDVASYQPSSLQQIVIHKSDEKGSDKPLVGKKILLAEDSELFLRVSTTFLCKLGANVEVYTNGKEAFNQVCKALSEQKKAGDSKSLPYDYILMDCEMPVMNGYEAARLIRLEEEQYGVHIPIIAVSAHAVAEEGSKSMDAGMDFHLTKPLQKEKLLDVIQSIDSQ